MAEREVDAARRRNRSRLKAAGEMNRGLIRLLRKELRAAADPEKAPGMQCYMKSDMPYFGVQIGKPVK